MIRDSFQGIRYFLRGFSLIGKPGIRRFVIIPFLLNVLVFSLLIYYSYDQFGYFLDWLIPSEDSWLNWLRWILIPIFFSVVAVAMFFLFTIVASVLSAPFCAPLASAVEFHLTGKADTSEFVWKDFLASILPSIFSELQKMLYYIVISLPFIILFAIAFFIPVLNIVASIAWLLVTAWILAVQYSDYAFDNHNIAFPELRQRLGKRRFLAFGFGGSTMLMMSIPVLNFILIPVAIAGATAMSFNEFEIEAGHELRTSA